MASKLLFVFLAVLLIQDSEVLAKKSAIESIVDGVMGTVTKIANDSLAKINDAMSKVTDLGDEIMKKTEASIFAAVAEVQKQIDAIGDNINACAIAEADRLETVAQAGIDKVQTCVSYKVNESLQEVQIITKSIEEFLEDVTKATKPLVACGKKSILLQPACIATEQTILTAKMTKLSADLALKVTASSVKIGKIQVELGACLTIESVKAVADVSQVGIRVTNCMAS